MDWALLAKLNILRINCKWVQRIFSRKDLWDGEGKISPQLFSRVAIQTNRWYNLPNRPTSRYIYSIDPPAGTITQSTQMSKQSIITRYLGHVSVTGYQPIRDQYFLIRSVPAIHLLLHFLCIISKEFGEPWLSMVVEYQRCLDHIYILGDIGQLGDSTTYWDISKK